MKKLGLTFWLCVAYLGIIVFAICWRFLTGFFPFSGSINEIGKIVIFSFIGAFAIGAYEQLQTNSKTIDELAREIETLRCEVEELRESLPDNNAAGIWAELDHGIEEKERMAPKRTEQPETPLLDEHGKPLIR